MHHEKRRSSMCDAGSATQTVDDGRVEVWKEDHGWNHPYPWRFRVWYAGRRIEFGGIANQCATERQARARAWVRLRWLRSGEFDLRYLPPATR